MRRLGKLVRQTGASQLAKPHNAVFNFCKKTKAHYWQGWILPPIAPTLEIARCFCPPLILRQLFGEQGSGFILPLRLLMERDYANYPYPS